MFFFFPQIEMSAFETMVAVRRMPSVSIRQEVFRAFAMRAMTEMAFDVSVCLSGALRKQAHAIFRKKWLKK